MEPTTTFLIAIVLFLLANLVVGLRESQGIKTFQDYIHANKSLGSGVLMATMVATLFDAGNIGLKLGFLKGLVSLVYPLLLSLSALFLGFLVFPNLVNFKKENTIADVMYTMYGPMARIITVLISTLFSLLIIISQLVAFGSISPMFGMHPAVAIVFLGGLVTLYTCTGGIRSVAKTDIIQLLVIVVGILTFFMITTSNLGGVHMIFNNVAKDKNGGRSFLSLFQHKEIVKRLFIGFFWCLFPTMLIAPPIIQRGLMTQKKNDIRNMFAAFAVLYPFLRLLMVIIGLGRFSIENNITDVANTTLSSLVTALCTSPLGKLCFLLATVAIIMSTIDSFLNALAIVWVHDVVCPWTSSNNKKIDLVYWTRFASLLLGTLCTAAGFLSLSLKIDFFVLQGCATIMLSSITIPFIVNLLGLRGSSRSFIVSIITFFLSIIIPFTLFQLGIRPVQSFINFYIKDVLRVEGYKLFESSLQFTVFNAIWYFAITISSLALFVTHYLEHGRFQWVDREKNRWKEQTHYTLGSFFTWLIHPIAWCNEKARRSVIRPFMVGFFTIIYYLFPYITATKEVEIFATIGFLRIIPIALWVLMMTKQHWSQGFKRYFNLLYYASLLYSYPFMSSLIVLLDGQNSMMLVYVAIGLLFVGYLVDWGAFAILHLLGIATALVAKKLLTGTSACASLGNNGAPLLISIFFPVLFIALFVRYKDHLLNKYQQQANELKQMKKMMVLTYEESHDQVYDALHKDSSMMTVVDKATTLLRVQGADPKKLKSIKAAMKSFYDVGIRAKEYLNLTIQPNRLQHMLDQAHQALVLEGIDMEEVNIYKKTRTDAVICDAKHIQTLIFNAVKSLKDITRADALSITIDQVYLDYEIPKIYHQKPEKALRFTFTNTPRQQRNAQKHYKPYDAEQTINVFDHIHLLENKRIIKAHYGFMATEKVNNKMVQTYVIPLDLKSMRPKISKFVHEDLTNVTQITSPQDRAFLQAIKEKGFAVKKIELALKTAKHYHYGQKRKSGEDFYTHPLAVATILLDHTNDPEVIIAALLHDTIEDTPYNIHRMTATFEERVTDMVCEVTHQYSKEQRPKVKLGKSESLDTLIKKGNPNALLIKLADRLHNMQTIQAKKPERQRAIAEETRDFFIGIAQELGAKAIEQQLKKLVKATLSRLNAGEKKS